LVYTARPNDEIVGIVLPVEIHYNTYQQPRRHYSQQKTCRVVHGVLRCSRRVYNSSYRRHHDNNYAAPKHQYKKKKKHKYKKKKKYKKKTVHAPRVNRGK
jgi:hypothetical protein